MVGQLDMLGHDSEFLNMNRLYDGCKTYHQRGNPWFSMVLVLHVFFGWCPCSSSWSTLVPPASEEVPGANDFNIVSHPHCRRSGMQHFGHEPTGREMRGACGNQTVVLDHPPMCSRRIRWIDQSQRSHDLRPQMLIAFPRALQTSINDTNDHPSAWIFPFDFLRL